MKSRKSRLAGLVINVSPYKLARYTYPKTPRIGCFHTKKGEFPLFQ